MYDSVLLSLLIALTLIVKSSLNMIHEKEIFKFLPFFILGLVLAFTTGFLYYGFFGISTNIYISIKLIVIAMLFVILCKERKNGK